MEIVEYGLDKLDVLYKIEKAATVRYDEIVPDFLGELLTRTGMRQLFDAGVRCYVAEVDGEPAGFIGYIAIDDIAFIRGLFVPPEFQRRGVGSSLLEFHENLAKTGGAKSILLLAMAGANWAQSFYAKHGYSDVVEGKDEIIKRYWPPLPDSMRFRYPDVPMTLLEKKLS